MGKQNIITDEQRRIVRQRFEERVGARSMARELGITRWAVQQIYKELGIYNSGRARPRITHKQTEKQCASCPNIKPIDQFRKRIGKHADGTERISYESSCMECELKYAQENNHDIYERNKQWHKDYQQEHWEEILAYQREYMPGYMKERRQYDMAYKLRCYMSTAIGTALLKEGGSKNGNSILQYLPYTIAALKSHLESLFEDWMTWDNYGVYNKENWKDKDSATWTWQIDHIIPQSDLPYTSMEDKNFKKCWSLSNLRPYSAKQNQLDGVTMVRHGAKSVE